MRVVISRQGVLAACLLPLLVILLDSIGFFGGLDRRLYDVFHQIRGSAKPSDRIVIAAIDDRTLHQLGRWPIDRRHYGTLLDRLGGAAVVAFDIIMGEASDGDGVLREAISRHGRVVLPEYLSPQGERILPVQPLLPVATGHIHIDQDVDGIARKVYHTILHKDHVIPSLGSAIFDCLVGKGFVRRTPGPSSQGDGEMGVPFLFHTDPMTINYYGPRETFRHISFVEILEGKWQTGFFTGKIVLVGVTVGGIENELITPFTGARERIPGVEVHANILNNLLDSTYYRELNPRWTWLACVLLSIVHSLLCFRRTPGQLVVIWICSVVSILAINFGALVLQRLVFTAAPMIALVSAASVMSYVTALREMQVFLFQAQRDWEESFDAIEDAIVIHGEDGDIARMNRAAAQHIGTSLRKRLRERCMALRAGAATEIHPAGSEEGGEGDLGRWPGHEYFDPDSKRYYEVRSIPRTDKNGFFSGAVHVLRNITEQKTAEAEQRKLQTMLIQAQKMEAIGTLAGGIAHDFNNILAAIIGYAELALAFGDPSEKVLASLSGIRKAGNRGKDLVGQILNLSRPGEHELKPVRVSLVVSEVLKFLSASLPKTIEIQEDLKASSDAVLSDATHLHQIVMNLCANAAHAMGKEGGMLRVSLSELDLSLADMELYPELTPGPYLKLSVADTGCGMEKCVAERIFDPYFTTKAPGEGTGMGLAVVQRIVKNHKGCIRVRSEVGCGTVFDVYLPRIATPPPSRETSISSLSKGHGRILLVDDEEALAYVGKEALESLGYDVASFTSSRDALETFLSDPNGFDLVITDQNMPQMMGTELAGRIRDVRKDIPILLCTGYSDAATREELEAMSIAAVLSKPLSIYRLSQEIRKALNNP